MSSVTGRIKEIKQPYGGYIRPSQFEEIIYNDGKVLGEENVHASVIGMAVDYLTRFMMGATIDEAFKISKKGYEFRVLKGGKNIQKKDKKKNIDIDSLLKHISGLDNESITAACKAVTYDVWYRNPMAAILVKGAEETNPDKSTINNIRIMVERSIAFWGKYGPITVDGFDFEPNGYTETVDTGDGDYLTEDTMWDFKVSRQKPTSKHTLQLLMYWIMGQHSGKEEFKNIKKLGFFNPRRNAVYIFPVELIPEKTIRTIEDEVICYNRSFGDRIPITDDFLNLKVITITDDYINLKDRILKERIRHPRMYRRPHDH